MPALVRRSLGPRLTRLEDQVRSALSTDRSAVERLRADPTGVMAAAGMTPDLWQDGVLRSDADRVLLLCSRQSGKSSVSAALAVSTALLEPGSPVLLLSPSDRQTSDVQGQRECQHQVVVIPLPPRLERLVRRERDLHAEQT
jgi:hypothetical protein